MRKRLGKWADAWFYWIYPVFLGVCWWPELRAGSLEGILIWTFACIWATGSVFHRVQGSKERRAKATPTICGNCGKEGTKGTFIAFLPGFDVCSTGCFEATLLALQNGPIQIQVQIDKPAPPPAKQPTPKELKQAENDLKKILRDV